MNNGKKYSEEQHKFLRKYIPGHSYKEIAEAFNKRFNGDMTSLRVKSYIGNHKLNTGRTGQFEKGNIPHNKGMKGVCPKGCEKTWYKKGSLPHNTKPIGYERKTKDGYTEVKIAMRPGETKSGRNFVLKHRLIWEKTYGPIPKGYKVVFLDGDKENFDIKNLALLTHNENLQLTRRDLRYENAELTKTGILIAKAEIAVKKRRNK